MKLSELSTDKALDVLCELTPSVASIIEDDDVVSGLANIFPKKNETEDKTGVDHDKKTEAEDGETNFIETGIQIFGRIGTIVPLLLKKHRAEMYHILSVLNEKSVDEIAKQKIGETIKQARESFQDSELLTFFKSFVRREQNAQSAPSAGSHVSE